MSSLAIQQLKSVQAIKLGLWSPDFGEKLQKHGTAIESGR